MSQPKVSVIIPIYNVESYIEKCTRSLFGQTLLDMELIFIDDCSPDRSIEVMQKVLKEFPDREGQVKLIRHDHNYGVARSRQDGIDAASGEYIIHCDPDDWVELDMYESLYKKAIETDSDLVICDFYQFKNNQITLNSQEPEELSSISLIEGISGRLFHKLHGSLWNKLLKATYYTDARIPLDLSFCEDQYFWFVLLQNNLKIQYLNRALYIYRYNESSIINTVSESATEKDILLLKYVENLSKSSSSKRYFDACMSFIVAAIYYRLLTKSNLSNKKFASITKKYIKYIKYNRSLPLKSKISLYVSMYGFVGVYRKLRNLYYTIKYKYSKLL
ncbi:MAG: glycosyltransferase [Muribaculaceae bacterium]|nr:glycosyltransferase [Muribaculaceae bacterium]